VAPDEGRLLSTAVWNSGVIARVSAQLETDLHRCGVLP
jgi:hypothetical protein